MLVVHEDLHGQEIPESLNFCDFQDGDGEEVVELSLNSVVGLSALRTMKIKGHLTQQKVIRLIDCGATHNFISNWLVQKLGLSVEATSGYGVLIGTGKAIKGEGICKGVLLNLQNIEIMKVFCL